MQDTSFGSCILISEQKPFSSSGVCIITSEGGQRDDLSSGKGKYTEPSQPLLKRTVVSNHQGKEMTDRVTS